MRHLSEEDLILIYYNEPGARAGAGAHLAACETCRAAADALAATLDICDEWKELDPGPEFGRATWARLAPQLRNTPRHWLTLFCGTHVRITAGATAALLVIAAVAFMAGRGTRAISRPAEAITAGLSTEARERILEISLADHLDRAGRLMTEISNLADADARGLTLERVRAQDLVNEGRLMRQWLAGKEGAAALPLLDDVERFMMELANAPDGIDLQQIRQLKQRIDAESLLFKVRIIESNLRNSGRTS
jgi:hypothetical protein